MLPENIILQFDAFKRLFEQNKDQQFAFLLGAGASISSGIPSAYSCIWDWKRLIYLSNNPKINHISIESENDKREIQRWLDLQQGFPDNNSEEEYSFYIEKAFPDERDRISYFENLFRDKQPSIGYHLLAFLAKNNIVPSIWTTNFDGLSKLSAERLGLTVYPISIDTKNSIFNSLTRSGLKYIALHGDYKYSKIKNTGMELDNQVELFIEAMKTHFSEKHLIIIGYSGRDKSLMEALMSAYSQNGGGRLFWLGIENEPTPIVRKLILKAKESGRSAYYIPSPGFDESLFQLVKFSLGKSENFQSFAKEYLISTLEPSISPFKINEDGKIVQYATTNLIPLTIPSSCYAFTLKDSSTNSENNILFQKIQGKKIAIVRFKGKIYAIGSMAEILSTLSHLLDEKPTFINITPEALSNFPILKKLFLKAIILGISAHTGLKMSLKGFLWDENLKYQNYNNIFEAIKVNLRLNPHHNYLYLSVNPTLYFENDKVIDKKTKQEVSRKYFDQLRNKDFFEKINYWINNIFGGQYLTLSFSEESKEFIFKLSPFTAFSKVYGEGPRSSIYSTFNHKRITFISKKIPEPNLIFANPQLKFVRDIHPMRGLNCNLPFDIPSFALNPLDINLGIICPASWREKLYNFLIKLNNGTIEPRYYDYIFRYQGFRSAYKVGLNIPYFKKDEMWVNCKDVQPDGFLLASNICNSIDRLCDIKPKSVIINTSLKFNITR